MSLRLLILAFLSFLFDYFTQSLVAYKNVRDSCLCWNSKIWFYRYTFLSQTGPTKLLAHCLYLVGFYWQWLCLCTTAVMSEVIILTLTECFSGKRWLNRVEHDLCQRVRSTAELFLLYHNMLVKHISAYIFLIFSVILYGSESCCFFVRIALIYLLARRHKRWENWRDVRFSCFLYLPQLLCRVAQKTEASLLNAQCLRNAKIYLQNLC